MSQLILELIRAGGPVFGPLLFIFTMFLTWGYHSLLYQVSVRQNRFALFLLDKGVGTLHELYTYGLLSEVGSAANDLNLIRKGAV
jgi:hypothetical protein